MNLQATMLPYLFLALFSGRRATSHRANSPIGNSCQHTQQYVTVKGGYSQSQTTTKSKKIYPSTGAGRWGGRGKEHVYYVLITKT